MTRKSSFKTPEGEAAFLAAYETAMNMWPVPYAGIDIPTRFGMSHVVTCGPQDAPPLVLLHGSSMTSAMWSPNITDFSQDYRVYAIDVIGQPGKSIPDPDEPIRDEGDFMTWLQETLDGLHLERISLVGMSYGGWLALSFAMIAPERICNLVLLSPAASFQPLTRQFMPRVILMSIFPARWMTDSLMGWMGIKNTPSDPDSRCLLDLFYQGAKHFQVPSEMMGIFPGVFSDEELQALQVPVLLLIGDREVIYDPVRAMDRARALIPDFEGELVPGSNHNMCGSHYQIVDRRVLNFLGDH